MAAIQAYNNPTLRFRSESFILLMTVAWTYLLHAHYRQIGIDYRYSELVGGRRRLVRTRGGAFKYWDLERCLNDSASPLDGATTANLRLLLGLRNEVTHHMSPDLDDYISARCQACFVNYNTFIKKLHGERFGLDAEVSYSIQLQRLSLEQLDSGDVTTVPERVRQYISTFDASLPNGIINDHRYAYRMYFIPRVVGKPGQADRVIEFIRADSELGKDMASRMELIRETERPKFRPGLVVELMKGAGFRSFSMHSHTELWKEFDAKSPAKGYGVDVAGTWYWYQSWVDFVERYCRTNSARYR